MLFVWIDLDNFSNVVDSYLPVMLHLNISLKNFCASPSRFCFISVALRLWRFSFCLLSALRFQLPFFRFGSAKVGIFFLSASFFWKFYFPFCLPLCSFSIPSSLALSGLCSPCLGLQKWDSFFIPARSFFIFFSRFLFALFSMLKQPCAASFCLPRFVLGLQRWGYFSYPARAGCFYF